MIRAFLLVLGPPSSIAGTKFKTQVYSGQSPIHSLQTLSWKPTKSKSSKNWKEFCKVFGTRICIEPWTAQWTKSCEHSYCRRESVILCLPMDTATLRMATITQLTYWVSGATPYFSSDSLTSFDTTHVLLYDVQYYGYSSTQHFSILLALAFILFNGV